MLFWFLFPTIIVLELITWGTAIEEKIRKKRTKIALLFHILWWIVIISGIVYGSMNSSFVQTFKNLSPDIQGIIGILLSAWYLFTGLIAIAYD